jgi:16S rRNA (guanine(966)-N(2))-methyltransferase RsmD
MASIRVISGKARGRRLHSVPGDKTRPITDRTKEALFNIIGNDIEGAKMLDLFAGTGAVGIEALSRGADFVRFVDIQRMAIQTLNKNLQLTGLSEGAQVIKQNAFVLLESTPDIEFEYVYIAPPQYKEYWQKAILSLDKQPGWMAADAWIIVQIHPVEYQEISLMNLRVFDQRRYGSSLLIFLTGR